MSTTPERSFVDRRRRRLHTDAFKADAVAACTRPGVSMAAVAMAHGINANLLRRWVHAAEMKPSVGTLPVAPLSPTIAPMGVAATSSSAPKPSFVPMTLPPAPPAQSISIEVRRGTTSITVTWPTSAAAECATWLRELFR